ncbi:MAG: aldehyde dehydrogenase family protein [Roseiflexaceae bacterium]
MTTIPPIPTILRDLSYGPAPESAKPAYEWLDAHQRQFGQFLDGTWTQPDTARLFETINPANRQVLAQITQASSAEVDAAVAAAQRALPAWSALSGHARARYLYALARSIQKHSRLFAVLETLDNGKPIRETRDIDIPLVARHFYHHAGWAQLAEQEFAGYHAAGVVGQIIPWNFPLLMLAWKVAPALAAGCTVVLKPAELTPLTALLFAEIAQRAGLPAGVLNIVNGDGSVGSQIVEHPGINKIAFTGSTEVGRIIRSATAGSGKALSLELGGKSPFIVFEKTDIDSVVEGVVDAIWFNQGQVCCAGSRLIVQESVAERLIAKLRARIEKLRVGDPLDKAIDIGAIISPQQLSRIERLVEQGRSEGADVWQPSWACPTEGYFYPPTLLTNVAPAASVAQIEIFGPVLAVMTFRTPAEAVALANNTRYGLAASVWSEDINVALDIARQIKAGVIWINGTNMFDAAAGFGGYRESGYGREGGREGMYEYLKPVLPAVASPATINEPSSNGIVPPNDRSTIGLPAIDRTPKLYIGGKQARPDSGYSRSVLGAHGQIIGEVGDGNRKDLRNAVEAARAAQGAWGNQSAHGRAQVIYYLAENLSARAAELAKRIEQINGASHAAAAQEIDQAIDALFAAAAWADKYDGAVHHTPFRGVTMAVPEPIGVVGLICPEESPLLGMLRHLAVLIAMGNTTIVVPSERFALLATDLYQILDTSDVPGGVVNIITGGRAGLAKVLADHLDVDGLWSIGDLAGRAILEKAAAGNLKRTWAAEEATWLNYPFNELLRQATQIKNIWVPYGA